MDSFLISCNDARHHKNVNVPPNTSITCLKFRNVQTAQKEPRGGLEFRSQSCWVWSLRASSGHWSPASPLGSYGWRLPYISGMMKTEMSSPEPRWSLLILHPRSLSTPRALITRSWAAIVYLTNRGHNHEATKVTQQYFFLPKVITIWMHQRLIVIDKCGTIE